MFGCSCGRLRPLVWMEALFFGGCGGMLSGGVVFGFAIALGSSVDLETKGALLLLLLSNKRSHVRDRKTIKQPP